MSLSVVSFEAARLPLKALRREPLVNFLSGLILGYAVALLAWGEDGPLKLPFMLPFRIGLSPPRTYCRILQWLPWQPKQDRAAWHPRELV
jgi:hypothetical protein